MIPPVVQQVAPPRENTLGDLFRRTAHAQLPTRFYSVLQICAPFALQFWSWGWHRTAGWLVVASGFGLWGLAQQHLEGHADTGVQSTSPLLRRVWRALRGGAAVVGSLTALVLFLEAFAQIMAGVFKCPGCSG